MEQKSLPWQQAIRNNRLLTIVVTVESACIVILGIAIAIMLPLKEKIPVYVEFSSGGNNFVRVSKAGEELQSNLLLLSFFLRKYVIDRETIDKTTESVRYARIAAQSSKEIAKQFQDIYGDKNKGLYYKIGFKRSVRIIRDDALVFGKKVLGRDGGIHQIEIETADTMDNFKSVKKTEWVVTLKYVFSAQKDIVFEERFQNPLGIVVMEYTITARKTEKR